MFKRLVSLSLLVGAMFSFFSCDSGEEDIDDPADQLVGNWTLVSHQGSPLPVQLPELGQMEILESGDLTIAADTTWQMRLNGSNVNAPAGADWVITLSGGYVVVDHVVTFAVAACVEVGANPECPASVAGAEISAWNWTENQMAVSLQMGDQIWSLGFAR